MKKFKALSTEPTYEVEKRIREEWEKEDILELTIKNRENNPYFVFYDGPATANGHPGLHHMLAKFLKDTMCKYKVMQGYKVERKIGWDTHGLPVEVQVEKQLGFTGKKDIEKYGIKEFNQKCKESVWEFQGDFEKLTKEMGQFIDTKNPYITYKNDYIETEWWILKKFFDEGLFYQGSKILPYCPRCGTGLASHEVAQGYEDTVANTVIVPFKKKNEDVYFLAWTTTPWTLISNVALCVNPKEEYVKVLSKGTNYILAKKLLFQVLGDDYEILETYKGKDLEYMEYEQLIPSLEVKGNAFIVTCADYVTMEDGTGIVHTAPAFGADDAQTGKKYKLAYVNPVGDDGKFTEGIWKGKLVFDADLEVIDYLKENNKLFRKQKITHSYPHCWRCHSPLIYYSKPSYYLEITKLKDKIVENNKKVNWYPKYVGEKRFGNWLENLNDWAISRSRYWGTPLPLWTCECGHEEMIGSREELASKAIEKVNPKDIELHRPFIDEVHLKCPKCGKTMSRVSDVLDCWFDSGAMPFAQYHYPFENESIWEKQFPADFICEGVDQTRGWFYSLIVISTFIKGVSPYKNVLVNDLLLDAEGKKMSKSKGNIVEPFTTMHEYGADTVRFYLPYVSPVWTPIRFDYKGLNEVHSKFFNPLKNTYNFFSLYANTDSIDITKCNVEPSKREEIDRWLLSKYNNTLKNVTSAYEEYDLNKVVHYLTDFVSDDLSNWYIRRNRDRFWSSKLDDSKKSVYITTYEVLCGICKMTAPVAPYLTEEMYQDLTGEKSVHLTDFPKYDSKLIDKKLETKMDLVRNLISIGRNIREENNLKVRQPLQEILLDGKLEKTINNLDTLIMEELNVKNVTYIKDLSKYMNFIVKPNYKEVGKTFGSSIKEYENKLSKLTDKDIMKLEDNKSLKLNVNDKDYDINKDMVDIRISAKEGFNVGMENNNFVILNTTLNDDLVSEGLAREFISKVQQLRKNKDLDVADRINITFKANGNITEAIKKYDKYIKSETLAKKIEFNENALDEVKINDDTIYVTITKA
jgi:isoleucyl-tRNA synthetase